MSTKLRSLCLVAAVAAGTIIVTPAVSVAAETTCGPVANIFTMQADGDLWLYRHADPRNGTASWAGASHIGTGWGGKTFAGPDGRVYNITTWGDLRRLRYNGGGWDTFPGGGQYETIGTGWQKFVETANRGKITVDSDGSFYTLEGDQLRWWHYDEGARSWAPGSGRVLDVGWSRFDTIAASGKGGLQARDAAGDLHRFRYHRDSERFMAYDLVAGPPDNWVVRGKLFSAGGDVYYNVRPDTGELVWNRFIEYLYPDWERANGAVIGTDWGTDVDVTATTTDCSITGLSTPAKPLVHDENVVPTQIVEPASGGRHLVGTTFDNQLVADVQTDSGWTREVLGGKYSGVSNAVFDDVAGTATLGGTKFETGDVQLNTLRAGRWQGFVSLKGAMETSPVLVRRENGTTAVFATAAAHHDSTYPPLHLWLREQLPNGDFLAWRQFGDRESQYNPVSAITRGDETTMIVKTSTGKTQWFRQTPGTRPVFKGELANSQTLWRATLTGDGNGNILAFAVSQSGGVRVPHVLREKADHTGFEDTWQSLGEFGWQSSDSDRVAALLLPNGTVALAAPSDHKLYVTTSKGPGAAEFHPWTAVEPPPNATFTDLPSLALSRAGDVLLSAEAWGAQRHLFTASIPVDPATPLVFAGGPIN